MVDSPEVAGSPPAWFAQAFGQLSEEIQDVKRETRAARAELAASKSNQVTLKQAGLQKQFDVNPTVLDCVEGALTQLPSGHDAAAYLAKSKATLTLRQKHLRIADAYDWKTVEVYENGVLRDGMADDKRIAEAAATARRIAARPYSTGSISSGIFAPPASSIIMSRPPAQFGRRNTALLRWDDLQRLTPQDISICGTHMSLHLRRRKNDQLRQGDVLCRS